MPVTSSVQMTADSTEEFCDTSLYCDYNNMSDVVGVQLQVLTSSSDWVTVYQLNFTTANSIRASSTLLAVSLTQRDCKPYSRLEMSMGMGKTGIQLVLWDPHRNGIWI